ncbi:hypothetical protein X801_06750 [Opisthorchis viverrini]|uniref:Uncharacterized protein n=1 Tax=Opisthorchis viverrini TaxID=6198 RepID=A0A1S8WSJ5_OPIVI|nr:hypothetical protein X801_06750 [Opisthorchis viverrini]
MLTVPSENNCALLQSSRRIIYGTSDEILIGYSTDILELICHVVKTIWSLTDSLPNKYSFQVAQGKLKDLERFSQATNFKTICNALCH